MRRFLFLFLVFAVPTFAQLAVVSGTVTDVNGLPYSNASLTITLSTPSGTNGVYLFGKQIGGSVGPVQLDSTGSYLVQLAANTFIQCGNAQGQIVPCVPQTTWLFSVTLSPGIPPPLGTGPQTCTSPITISGLSQTVSLSSCPSISQSGVNSKSGAGPTFNVKGYGAHGDTQSSINCTTSTLNLNCTDVTFTPANVQNRVSCRVNGGGLLFGGTPTTFTTFIDSHDMTLATSGGSFSATCMWGTPDDSSVNTILPLALAQVCSLASSGNTCTTSIPPTVYFPAGAYNLFNTSINIAPAVGGVSGFTIKGDGADLTKIYWHENSTNAQGAALQVTGAIQNVNLTGFTLDGATLGQSFSNGAVLTAGNVRVQDVTVQRFGATGVSSQNGWISQGGILANRLNVVSNSGDGFRCAPCNGEVYESLFSNNGGVGLLLFNVTGLTTGGGFRLVNSLLDENTGAGGTSCDVTATNSIDVWLQGVPIFGSTSSPFCGLSVDGTSFIHWAGGLTGPFGSEFPKTGVKVAAGGTLQASDVRMVGAGTGNCAAISGNLYDNGGNSCETVYAISSGTSTGTTAVLTLASNTVNVNTNCAVGDALIVEGAGIPGYNGYFPAGATTGITAVTASTLTYTTAGANLGALGAGGNAFCRNLLTYSGTLPTALLSHSTYNAFQTGTLAVGTVQTWRTDQALYISSLSWTPSNAAACTAGSFPVIQLTDGTVTLNTAATDTFVNGAVTHTFPATTANVFPPNDTIQLKVNSTGTCGTAPTNTNFNASWRGVLSN
jgi:hypothetical protein